MIFKLTFLTLVLLLLQGCSFVVNLAFFNNTDEKIEICNLNKTIPNCYSVDSKALFKIPLIGDYPTQTGHWQYSINEKLYSFKFGQYPEHASDVYCTGFVQKRCDIAIQYQPDGLLYWAGKSMELPVSNFDLQPKGFPVKPTT